ncbi:MAG: hypothetical protein DRH56_06980 [Deltaproteobacteria bacterium]|nr:MAG: hypothetical protein DRH56_06980 [Deltaproteobacteria bacterium]
MEKVLLAVDSITPSRRIFRYAVELCRRIRAELEILQVIRQGNRGSHAIKKGRTRVRKARRYFEGSMMAAAFAEAGEHRTARDVMAEAMKNMEELLPESESAGIRCRLEARAGDPKKEIPAYLHRHRDVVLTIYDPGPEEKGREAFVRALTERVAVPLVILQGEKA